MIKFGLLLCVLVATNVQATTGKDANVAWAKIEAGAVLIDVRTPAEFARGHIENAINIPFEQILQGVSHYKIDKKTPIVVYCRSGRRSGIANQDLLNAGFEQSYNGGGFVPLIQHKQQRTATN
nr:rhodanese-like domain-containing protein [Shewanella gelidii]